MRSRRRPACHGAKSMRARSRWRANCRDAGMTKARRRAAVRRGRWAERLAACWLIAKGYRILDRNQRTPFGEIDLVARRGRPVALVEVKARVSRAVALEALR